MQFTILSFKFFNLTFERSNHCILTLIIYRSL